MVNFAVVGFGKMGIFHAALTNAHPEAKVVGVVDTEQRLTSALSRFNPAIRCFTSVSDLLEKQSLDAFVITTPANTHLKIAEQFASSGVRHGLIEKPLATSCADFERSGLSPESTRGICVGYMMRFYPTFARAKELLDSGLLGTVRSFRGEYYITSARRALKGWRSDPRVAGGGVLTTNASHLIDMLNWYFGPPTAVNGLKQHYLHDQVEDAFQGMLHYPDGKVGSIATSWTRENFRTHFMRVEVFGERGELEVDTDEIRMHLFEAADDYPKGIHHITAASLYRGSFFDIGGPEYSHQTETLLSFIKTGNRASLCSFDEARRVHRVIDAFYRSANTQGTPVRVNGN